MPTSVDREVTVSDEEHSSGDNSHVIYSKLINVGTFIVGTRVPRLGGPSFRSSRGGHGRPKERTHLSRS